MSKKLRDNYNVRIKQPIDSRFICQNLNEIDRPYEGLITLQLSDGLKYEYRNDSWIVWFKNDYVNVKDFGAKGDWNGSTGTDDTLAIQNAINYAINNSMDVYFPKGTYLTDNLTYSGVASAVRQIGIFGSGINSTTLQKKSADGKPILTIGTSTQQYYISEFEMKGINFLGISSNSEAVVKVYSLVRSQISNIRCSLGIIGFLMYGGIATTFDDCTFEMNQIGLKLDGDTSLYGGGVPNLITINTSIIGGNTLIGLYYDYGTQLTVNSCDIEANGTTGNSACYGVFIGANIGSGVFAISATLNQCWFESNAGDSSIYSKSGKLIVNQGYFIANPNSTYDIHIYSGIYHLDGCQIVNTKTTNLKEESTVGIGSSIYYSSVPALSIDFSKTLLFNNNNISLQSGTVPIVKNLSNPLIQCGTDSTASGTVNITFAFPFATSTTPVVTATMNSNSATILTSIEVYNITNTGFSVRKKGITSGSNTVATVNDGFSWNAIGTRP